MTEPAASADVAVVIVNYRSAGLAAACLAGLAEARQALPRLRVMVVDGASGDESVTVLGGLCAEPAYTDWAEFLPLPINGGFGWANNQAMLRLLQSPTPPEYIHLLNPDAVPQPGALVALIEALQADTRCAAAGSLLLEQDGQPSGSAFRFTNLAREFVRSSRIAKLGRIFRVRETMVRSTETAEVDWVTGASVMFRSTALREAGLFDDGFFLYFEEVELMWRVRRAGWRILHVPASRVVHIGGGSTGVKDGRGAGAEQRRLPRYWYESQRRLFLRTRGRAFMLAAGIAWLAGAMLWELRRRMRGERVDIAHEWRDRLAICFAPWRRGDGPAVVAWDSTPGHPPAWMTQ